jgi:hypothetical protein
MKISKRQLRRIIKEEKTRILREQETGDHNHVDTREHQWPSADGPISDAALDLATAWGDMEAKAWSAGDPSMNQDGELSDTESKKWWSEQVELAADDLAAHLEERLRQTSIEVMQEFTDKLIDGDFS